MMDPKKLDNKYKTICPLPWNHIHIPTSGRRGLCCHTSHDYYLETNGKSKTDMNLDELKKIRLQMINNERPESCSHCYNLEAKGVLSDRQKRLENERGPWIIKPGGKDIIEQILESTGEDGHSSFIPYRFDVRFDNVCQLACIMCDPVSSTRWYEEHYEYIHEFFKSQNDLIQIHKNGKKYYIDDPKFKPSSDEVIDDIIDYVKIIYEKKTQSQVHFYFAGGEPFASKKVLQFHEKLVSLNLPRNFISIAYNTNCVSIKQDFIDFWDKFCVGTIVSLDGIGKVNDYIRYPSKWEKIESNILKLRDNPNIYWLHSQTTLSVFNCLNLVEIMQWAEINKITPKIQSVGHVAYHINSLPKHVIDESIHRLNSFSPCNEHTENFKRESINILSSHRHDQKRYDLLRSQIKKSEDYRGNSIEDSIPDLSRFIR